MKQRAKQVQSVGDKSEGRKFKNLTNSEGLHNVCDLPVNPVCAVVYLSRPRLLTAKHGCPVWPSNLSDIDSNLVAELSFFIR